MSAARSFILDEKGLSMTLAIVCMSVCLVYAIAFSIGWRRAVGRSAAWGA